MTPPGCQGSLLAGPSSAWLPAGCWGWVFSVSCLCEAALLCSAPPWLLRFLCSSWIPLGGSQAVGPPLGCWPRVRTWLGAGDSPEGARDAQDCGAVPHGAPACPASQSGALALLGALLALPAPGPVSWLMDPWFPHGTLGSHWCHQNPPSSSPVLTDPSQQGLGGFSPSVPYFPAGPPGVCGRGCLGEPLAPVGCPCGAGAAPGGISQGGTEFRQPGAKSCQAPLFAFSRMKPGKHSVPAPWTLPCQEPGSSCGSQASPPSLGAKSGL